VFPRRTHTNPLNLHARELLNKLHILSRLDRQVIEALCARRRFLPPGERLILHLDLGKCLWICGESVELLALVRVRCGNLEFFEVVEDVEFGEIEGRVVVAGVRVFDDDEVEPAAASFAACCDANFVADLLELFAYFVELFCWEGAAEIS